MHQIKLIVKAYTAGLLTLFLLNANTLNASIITNGALTVEILDTNGTIRSVRYDGTEFFLQGVASAISDWGLRLDTETDPFVLAKNESFGTAAIPVTQNSPLAFAGNYPALSSQISFTRAYTLVPGFNILRVDTTFINNGPARVLSYFDTFDPDQGIDLGLGYSTYNDLFPLASAHVGQASISNNGGASLQQTVWAASLDSRATVAAGGLYSIFDGDELEFFFTAPYDGENTFADEGLHIGMRTAIAHNSTTRFTYDLVFASTPAAAQAEFLAANSIPEPNIVIAVTLASLLMMAVRLRHRA
jgi:hypothetical protein